MKRKPAAAHQRPLCDVPDAGAGAAVLPAIAAKRLRLVKRVYPVGYEGRPVASAEYLLCPEDLSPTRSEQGLRYAVLAADLVSGELAKCRWPEGRLPYVREGRYKATSTDLFVARFLFDLMLPTGPGESTGVVIADRDGQSVAPEVS